MNFLRNLLRRGSESSAELQTPADAVQSSSPVVVTRPALPTLRQMLEASDDCTLPVVPQTSNLNPQS